MDKKEEILNENNENILTNSLIKELQWFIAYTLIPGEIQPTIYWLSQYSTIELRLIFKMHIKNYKNANADANANTNSNANANANINEIDRISIMKGILLYYYPDCVALKENHKPLVGN